ncbi:MAG: peptidoglycan-binding protein [bacterium]|nr:peptidoglycan-binding protein [bacterium]
MRRAVAVGAVLLAVSVAAGLGWMAARNIRSPAQVALEAEPPAPSLITVEVERTELVADVITRADVGYDDPVSLRLGGALGGRPSTLIVTSARERGDELSEGAVAVEVSGRPVFLLQGGIPVYRDLLPQAEGPDVRQVEEALARLGYLSEEPDELWTPATEVAVEAWYAAAGYEANGISDEDLLRLETAGEAVKSAEQGVRTAQDQLEAAEDRLAAAIRQEDNARYELAQAREALAEAREGPDELAIRQARSAQASTEEQLAFAQADAERSVAAAERAIIEAEAREGPDELAIRQARSAQASAEEQLAFAQADAERSVAAAERAIIEAEAQRERAAVDYAAAGYRWDSARLGVHPDTGTPPTGSQLENLRQAVDVASSALDAAERGIEEAYEDLDRRVIETGAAIRAAADGLAEARSALDDLLVPPDVAAQMRAVQNARNVLDDALAETEDARSAIEDARSAIEDAEMDVVEAREALVELEDRTGIWIPAGELIFLERLPVRVDLVTAETGSSVTASFMTVSGSELAIRGSVLDTDVALVKEGGVALIEDSLLAEPLRGEIRHVADRPGTNGVASSRYYIEIVAEGIPDELVGSNVKVVIPVGGTAGEVLAVPAAALSATADGSTRVEVREPDGTTRFVRVEPGLSADGLVEITPLDGEIAEGDLVVIGVASGDR